ncbi:HAD-IA family hydrolase [Curvibacter sp. RS43]|uniref:HAD family hydrolase n=1 Tax=Curvibacter microcysteis TaxID=3026419 RepID=UPI00235E121D|nr:HAD-IA family hydrolase [Curvibacter sp. RS43]MDD0809634.1 HAD-IA family hydrolase [Curvibacter sp. RS43]
MLDLARIRAITLDLDDTLWPIWPTIARAEEVLAQWLRDHAPRTAELFAQPGALREIRNRMVDLRPDLRADLSALRRESIRLALGQAGDPTDLAEPAFDVFFAERQRVTMFDDAHPSLQFMAARYPLVAVSNGNADIEQVGLAPYFKAALNARDFGVAKPDPRIFHAAAEAAGVAPHEVLHVGDDAALDAVGALQSGLQAVWLNREQQAWTHEHPAPMTVQSLTELCAWLGQSPQSPA